MFSVYIIESQLDGTFYIGYSKNIEKRLEGHNRGQSKFTKSKGPWKLVYSESFENKADALRRERFLKRQKNRGFYLSLIQNWSGSSVG